MAKEAILVAFRVKLEPFFVFANLNIKLRIFSYSLCVFLYILCINSEGLLVDLSG